MILCDCGQCEECVRRMQGMTDQEKNKALAEWLGWEHNLTETHKMITYEWYVTGNGEAVILPDYLNTNSAFDLLDVLVEKGYNFIFNSAEYGYEFMLAGTGIETYEPTKSTCVCEAILQLIEKEKEK